MFKGAMLSALLVVPALLCLGQDSPTVKSSEEALKGFEREVESATARGDVAYLNRAIADDLTFTHGNAWTTGGKASRVDTKKTWIELVGRGLFLSRAVSAQQVEPHGSLAITTGRIDVKLKKPVGNRSAYFVWFVRVYRTKGDAWELVSHRTVSESESTSK